MDEMDVPDEFLSHKFVGIRDVPCSPCFADEAIVTIVEAAANGWGVFVGDTARWRVDAEDGDVVVYLDTQGASAFVVVFESNFRFFAFRGTKVESRFTGSIPFFPNPSGVSYFVAHGANRCV